MFDNGEEYVQTSDIEIEQIAFTKLGLKRITEDMNQIRTHCLYQVNFCEIFESLHNWPLPICTRAFVKQKTRNEE